MANRTFQSLVNRVSPYAPGCPNETMRRAIREAAIQVCERTQLWRHSGSRVQLLPGVHEYAYDIPTNSEVHTVFAAIMNDRPLELLNLDDAICKHPEWADLFSGEDPSVVWSETPGGAIGDGTYNEDLFNGGSDFVLPDAIIAKASTPCTFTQIAIDKYIVLPLPDDQEYLLRLFLALKPKRDADSMEEKAFNDLEDVIFHRTLNNLLIMPDVQWADRDAATYHYKQYMFLSGEKKARANLGNARGSLSVRYNYFA